MTGVTEPSSPRLVTAILTFLVACFAFVTFGRGYQARWEYPYLSLEDPAQLIFLRAEYERRVATLWPAKVPGGVGSLQDAGPAWMQLLEEERRAAADSPIDKASVERAMAGLKVVAAGWGNPISVAAVRGMSEANVPEYLVERIRQIKHGDTETDRARARIALRWHTSFVVFEYSALAVALVAPFFLWRRRRASAGERETGKTVVFGLAQAWVILAWSFAAVALAWRFYYTGVPVLADIGGALPSLVFALVALALVRDTRASDSPAPLRRMLALPNEPGTKRRWFFLAVALYGVSTTFAYLVGWAFWALGGSVPWGEFLVEPLIHGSGFLAFATVLELVAFAPLGEELLFRGVLFGALSSKLTTHRAALLSAVLFGLWHGYGIEGTLIVTFDGYLLARLYARTGSLLPGMLAHAAMNVAVCLNNIGCRA